MFMSDEADADKRITNAEVLWSWNIVFSEGYDPDAAENWIVKGGYTWMNRDLGALIDPEQAYIGGQLNNVALASTTGNCYQWGRKDPFPGLPDYTSVQVSYMTGLWFAPAYTPIPALDRGTFEAWGREAHHQIIGNTKATVAIDINTALGTGYVSQDAFDLGRANPHLWLYKNENYLTDKAGLAAWGNPSKDAHGVKTIYDPCPPGWKVMSSQAWIALTDNETPDAVVATTMRGILLDNKWYFPLTGGAQHVRNSDGGSVQTKLRFSCWHRPSSRQSDICGQVITVRIGGHSIGLGPRCPLHITMSIRMVGVSTISITAADRMLMVGQSIHHVVEHVKQALENLRPGDFRFLLVRQGVVGFISRQQLGVRRLPLLLAHSSQLVRRGQDVDQRLHWADGAHEAAGRPCRGRGIAAGFIVGMGAGVGGCFFALRGEDAAAVTACLVDMPARCSLHGSQIPAGLCVLPVVGAQALTVFRRQRRRGQQPRQHHGGERPGQQPLPDVFSPVTRGYHVPWGTPRDIGGAPYVHILLHHVPPYNV